MSFLLRLTTLLLFVTSIFAEARERIKLVGSSTIYPFATVVAEEYAAMTHHKTPLVESTGSGGGLKIFCQKDALASPDIADASRRIKIKEFEVCKEHGVDILELPIGYDGIALVQSIENERLELSQKQIFEALIDRVPSANGKDLIKNPHTKWSDIDPALPNREIIVYGPPTSSGTRDTFDKVVLEKFCQQNRLYQKYGCKIRVDGLYVPSGENDNIIIKRLQRDRDAVGIFGFSFLLENEDKVSAVTLDGITVDTQTIASGTYPITRKLYLYVDMSRFATTQGLEKFIELFVSDYIISQDGLLIDSGLVPLLDSELEKVQKRVQQRSSLTYSDLFNQ